MEDSLVTILGNRSEEGMAIFTIQVCADNGDKRLQCLNLSMLALKAQNTRWKVLVLQRTYKPTSLSSLKYHSPIVLVLECCIIFKKHGGRG